MLIEELFAAIHEKEEVLQQMKAEALRIEKDIETLRAAVRILEREAPEVMEHPTKSPRSASPETIRKAFP